MEKSSPFSPAPVQPVSHRLRAGILCREFARGSPSGEVWMPPQDFPCGDLWVPAWSCGARGRVYPADSLRQAWGGAVPGGAGGLLGMPPSLGRPGRTQSGSLLLSEQDEMELASAAALALGLPTPEPKLTAR